MAENVPGQLNILIVEDQPDDAELLLYELRQTEFDIQYRRVETEQGYLNALSPELDVIIADYSLPQFNAIRALHLLQEQKLDVPLIVVTGTVTDEIVVNCMRLGAADYLLKDRMARLSGAVIHALEERKLREEKRKADEMLRVYTAGLEKLVTERTEQLRQSKERTEAILSNIVDAIVLAHTDETIQQVNPAFYRMFGLHSDDVLNKSLLTLVSDESIPHLSQVLQSVQTERQPRRIEISARRKDGTVFDAEVALAPIIVDGSIQAIVLSIQDVTERKQMESALRASEERFRLLFENASATIFVVDENARYVDANRQAAILTGYSHEELLGMSVTDLATRTDAQSRMQMFHELQTSGTSSGEYELLRKDGSTVHVEFSATRISPSHYQSIVRDITERKLAEEKLRQALQKEKDINEFRSRFVSTISHEFRTPLASILSSSDLVKSYSNRMTEERKREHFDKIESNVRHLASLLDDVLTIAKAETVGLEFNPEAVDLSTFIEEIVIDMRMIAETHSINFSVLYNSGTAWVDVKLMRQVITNLVTNAVKYSAAGSNINIGLFCGHKQAIIYVSDEGIGIPLEDQEHLFEAFRRAKNVGTIGGTGLGLAIVKQGVEMHGGTVSFKSQEGVGTSFTIQMPVAR